MHELSLAIDLLDLAYRELEKNDPTARLCSIQIVVGKLAGVDIESLQLCIESVLQSSSQKGVELIIEEKIPISYCSSCNRSYSPERRYSSCLYCGSDQTVLQQGDELRLQSILIE